MDQNTDNTQPEVAADGSTDFQSSGAEELPIDVAGLRRLRIIVDAMQHPDKSGDWNDAPHR